MLIRYWFILNREDPYGIKNLGVSAFSLDQAKFLVKGQLNRLPWADVTEGLIDNAEIIENIDIRRLDQNHVIPNMGVVTFKGVWWPNLGFK